MGALQLLAEQLDWDTKNLACNLDFIPDDKLGWKPAPEANLALGTVHHLAGVIPHTTAILRSAKEGTSPQEATESKKSVGRKTTKQLLLAAAKSYLKFLQTVTAEDMKKVIRLLSLVPKSGTSFPRRLSTPAMKTAALPCGFPSSRE